MEKSLVSRKHRPEEIGSWCSSGRPGEIESPGPIGVYYDTAELQPVAACEPFFHAGFRHLREQDARGCPFVLFFLIECSREGARTLLPPAPPRPDPTSPENVSFISFFILSLLFFIYLRALGLRTYGGPRVNVALHLLLPPVPFAWKPNKLQMSILKALIARLSTYAGRPVKIIQLLFVHIVLVLLRLAIRKSPLLTERLHFYC
jgi:hypothetical protein